MTRDILKHRKSKSIFLTKCTSKHIFKQCSLCNFYNYLCNFILFPLLCSSGGLFRRKQVISLQTLRISSLASTNCLRYLYCLLWVIKGFGSPLLTSLPPCLVSDSLLSFHFRIEVFGHQL